MDNKKTQEALLEAIDIMIDQKLKKLKFNYYVDGVIQQVYSDDTYKVCINNAIYDKVPSLHRMDFQKNDTVQILVKNGDWNKKYIVEKTKADTSHNLYNIGERPALPKGANLDDYTTVGCWGVYDDAVAQTLVNCPSDKAGNFTVVAFTGQAKAEDENQQIYLMQIYEGLNCQKYFRFGLRFSADAGWFFSDDWWSELSTYEIKDYVVEQGQSGIWSYKKWNNGDAECCCAYSFKPSTTGTTYQQLAYPFRFSTIIPVVTLTKAQNATVYGEVFNSDASGNRPDIFNFCDITFTECQSTAYDIGVNIQVVGRWK